MKVKSITHFFFLFAVNIALSQTSYHIISETEMPMGSPMADSKVIINSYVKGKKIKTDVVNGTSSQIHCYTEDKCTIIAREKLSSTICGEGTPEEMKELIKSKDKIEYSDVTVQKTDKTQTLLGYECKNAVINYKISSMGIKLKNELIVWYTDKIKIEGDLSTGDANYVGVSNALVDAIKSVNGVVLKQEAKMNGLIGITTTVTQIDQKDLNDSEFIIEAKDCTKMQSLKDASKEIDKRNARRQAQQNSMNHQMRMH